MDSMHIYGLFQLAAVGLLLALGEMKLRRRGATLVGRPDFIASCVIGAGLFGRIHFVVEAALTGRIAPPEIPAALHPLAPGSTFFGAMAGVLAAIFIRRRAIPGGSFARLADDIVPGFAAAIFVGRLGCLLHGCCLGAISDLPWAMALAEDGGASRHPLPLYLGLAAIAAAALSGLWIRRDLPARLVPGSRSLVFAAVFCLARAWAESYRQTGPDPGWAQMESILIAAAALGLLLHRRRVFRFVQACATEASQEPPQRPLFHAPAREPAVVAAVGQADPPLVLRRGTRPRPAP